MLLYRLLAGHLPWTVAGATQLIDAHLYTDPAPLPPIPGVAPELDELCRRCLSKDPAGRPTAGEVAITLTALASAADAAAVAGAPQRSGGAPSVEGSARPSPGRQRTRIAAGVFAASTAAIVGWALLPTPDPAPSADAHSSTGDATAARPGPTEPSNGVTMPGGAGQPSARATTLPAAGTSLPTAGIASGDATTPAASSPTPAGGTTSASPGTTPPPGQATTFTSTGGTVRADCTASGAARLLSWTPAAPFKVDWVNAGPAAAATVTFGHGNRTVDMTVTCTGTDPVVDTTSHTR
ncbi:serine/threonine-protein kinase [Dactylosporangium cerinum]